MAGSVLMGRSVYVGTSVVVRKDNILGGGESLVFSADHWHEYPDGSLDVMHGNETVASFRPHRWDHVYAETHLIEVREGKQK